MTTLTPPMNPEIKQLWIDALRSGEFKQTTSVLNDDGEFCCLGVLCELAVRAGVAVTVRQAETEGVMAYDDNAATLPDSVMGWAGLTDANPTVYTEPPAPFRCPRSLAGCNDAGYDFAAIADLIEKNL